MPDIGLPYSWRNPKKYLIVDNMQWAFKQATHFQIYDNVVYYNTTDKQHWIKIISSVVENDKTS